ncbi:isoprenylcysteine carboxyl methyltransferase family protein [Pseudooceanicola sp. 200-1SW]|uniref:isoprenylcysteine carboxyl methyltransferase family protein n=1 Tax=Pseudooceanicola sp. 200-1SW TaxID=3425949 RepID=UPI003D7F4D67
MLTTIFSAAAVAIRLVSLSISKRNERALRSIGAVEHGARTSRALAAAHVLYYLVAIAESTLRQSDPSWLTGLGLGLYALSICALFWVIATLGRLWTVKLYIAPDHRLETNWVFRRIKHPNYVLNIVPELVGFAIVLQAWATLFFGLPLYLVLLIARIRQENRIMRETFPQY